MKVHRIVTSEFVRSYNREVLKKNNDNPIGCKFYSLRSGFFIITDYLGKGMYKIKFIDTREEYISSNIAILKNGEIKDYMFPSIFCVGYLGKEYSKIMNEDPELFRAVRNRFQNVLSRCYNCEAKDYSRYGAIGVRVSDRWLNFCNFYRDITSMENFNRELFIAGEQVLDKDLKQLDIPASKRIYDKDTVTLMSVKENDDLRDMTNADKSRYFILMNSKTNKTILKKNIHKFSKIIGISESHIRDALHKRYNSNTINNELSVRGLTKSELALVKSGKWKIDEEYPE